jgi:formate hydrogenlyase subunit 6/NADH:ubiquinone oxidoreductase subunit I
MKGIAKVRVQGRAEPILRHMLEERGLDEPPLWKSRPPETRARMARWTELGKVRDGAVNQERTEIADLDAWTAALKEMALGLGASVVGCAALTPLMVSEGVELPHDNIFCFVVAENYGEALKGPRAVETESTSVYVRCAEIATEMANHIRMLGYPALAHHNGGDDIMALPALYAAGFGELGKHGSLIHPELGASFRPGFVTTAMPLAHDAPLSFGVQDVCAKCNICTNNCPAEAIPPAEEFIVTEGVKRWITDVEKCYTISRLREQYCHICIDVCPYVHKANGDEDKKAIYKQYMTQRKKVGYRTPAWWPEDPPEALKG